MIALDFFLPSCRRRWQSRREFEFHFHEKAIFPEEYIRMCPWEATYVYNVACMARTGIVEVGRFHGGGTLLLSGPDTAPVHSVDIDPQNDELLKSYIEKHNIKNIHLHIADSTDPSLSHEIDYDVLFIDGDHSYDGVMADMKAWYPRLKKGGHMVFHDAYMEYNIPEAIFDFTADKDVRFILGPLNPQESWQSPFGSICHIQKLED